MAMGASRVHPGKTVRAEAYVIAHEVGHHVQNLLGILPKAQQAQRSADSKAGANHIQLQVELQADCLAGVWANRENESLRSQGNRHSSNWGMSRPPCAPRPRSATTRCSEGGKATSSPIRLRTGAQSSASA